MSFWKFSSLWIKEKSAADDAADEVLEKNYL